MGAGKYRESEFFSWPLFQALAKRKEIGQERGYLPKEPAKQLGVSFLSFPGKPLSGTAAPPAFFTPCSYLEPLLGFVEAATGSGQRSLQSEEARLIILIFLALAGPGYYRPGLQRGAAHGPSCARAYRRAPAGDWVPQVEAARVLQHIKDLETKEAA